MGTFSSLWIWHWSDIDFPGLRMYFFERRTRIIFLFSWYATTGNFAVRCARVAFRCRSTRKFSSVLFFGSNFSCSNLSTNSFWTCRLHKWFCKASRLRFKSICMAFGKFWWNRRALSRRCNCRGFIRCKWLTAATATWPRNNCSNSWKSFLQSGQKFDCYLNVRHFWSVFIDYNWRTQFRLILAIEIYYTIK